MTNDSYQPENKNVSEENYYTNGKFDKEKFYKYLKTKPKGKEGISEEVEKECLAEADKHQWNHKRFSR